MSASVRISRKAAVALEHHLFHCIPEDRAYLELVAALKPKRSVVAARKVKRAKKATKREQTSAIRFAVAERAHGKCECCGQFLVFANGVSYSEMDHFWGRAKAVQSAQNCWMLCRDCHYLKTNNDPSAAHWLNKYLDHSITHGHSREASKAGSRLQALELMEQVEVAP